MSITDALSRISMIQQQLEQLSGATAATTTATASPGTTTSTTADGSTTTPTATSATGATDFANALAQAQTPGDTTASFPTVADSEFGTLGAADGATSATSDLLSGGSAIGTSTALTGTSTALTGTSTALTLPSGASAQMTSDQQQFAQTLASDTGLDPGVVSAWLLSEESGSAAQGRQAVGNNDWLNIGYTGSGDYGTSESAWSNPVTAAAATAGWLKGEDTVPGYGTASSSIQTILQTAGQTPQAQIAALQDSGWAASGYPDLPQTYSELAG